MEQIALVTGGNRGIGFELCKQLGEKGFKVYLGSRNLEKGVIEAKKLQNVTALELDAEDHKSIEKAKGMFEKQSSKLHLLINNAGILLDPELSALHADFDKIRKTFEVNTLGPLKLSQVFSSLLQKTTNSQIVNISSELGQLSEMGSGYVGYRLSKVALNAVSKILASDFKASGVRVNSFCPGWVKTDMGGKSAHLAVEDSVKKLLDFILKDTSTTGAFIQFGKHIPF